MTPHDIIDDEARDLAVAYVLGALTGRELQEATDHIAACAACRAEVASLQETAAALAWTAPSAPVPAGLKARVLAAATGPRGIAPAVPTAQAWKDWSTDGDGGNILLLGAAHAGWEATGFDGIEARRLFVDTVGERVTMLVRMAPGTAYPAHVHAGPEECFVVSGDIDVGGVHMTAGSYQRVAGGLSHPVQSTRAGCVLLIVSSLHDELLSAHA